MQEAVHDVAHQLGFPKGVESPALANGFIEADKQLATNQRGGVASARFRKAAAWQAPGRRRGTLVLWGLRELTRSRPGLAGVIEGDDIRCAFVVEEGFVEAGDFRRTDEMNGQIEMPGRQQVFQQRGDNAAEQRQINGAEPLAIAQAEPAAHWPLPRCSSYAAMMRWTRGWRTTSRF